MSPLAGNRAGRAAAMLALAGAAVAAGALPLWNVLVVRRAEQRMSDALGRRVLLRGFRPGVRGFVASGVEVFGAPPFASTVLARAERVDIGWDRSAVAVVGLDLDYVRAGGADNLGTLSSLGRPRAHRLPAGAASPLPAIRIHGARVRGFVQPASGPRIMFRAGRVDAAFDGRGSAVLANAAAVVADVAGKVTFEMPTLTIEAAADATLVIHGSQGSLRLPGAPALLHDLAVDGSWSRESLGLSLTQGSPGGGRSLRARLDASGAGAHVTVDAAGLRLSPLEPAARPIGLGLGRATAGLRGVLELRPGANRMSYDLDVVIAGFDVANRSLDARPWHDLSFTAHLAGAIELAAGAEPTVRMAQGAIEALGIPLSLTGWVASGSTPRGEVRISIGGQGDPGAAEGGIECAPLLTRLPAPMRETLRGLELGGRFSLAASLGFDAANLQGLTIGLDVRRKCSVLREAEVVRAAGLGTSEVRYSVADENGERRPFALGPSNPAFAWIGAMPDHLPAAFVTAEDAHFHSHRGFDLEMIRRALVYDLEVRSFAKGASTITQQLAKNLFLDRSRTLARKLAETVLAWRLDSLVSKRRILELYLNAIELGPGIYGVKHAAHAYFGKRPRHLTPLESAHLASLAPNPRALAQRFREGRVDAGWLHHLYDLLAMMKRSGRLSSAELTAATGTPLRLQKI